MSRTKSPVPPHPPSVDPTVPPDQDGHAFCRRCSLAIVDGDPRHTMPVVEGQAEVLRRYEPGAER